MIIIVLTVINAALCAGSVYAACFARNHADNAHTYTDGAHESAMAAGKFMNEAGVHATTAKLHATKAEEGAIKSQLLAPSFAICDTCKTLVARFNKLEDGSIICVNCK